MAGRRIVVVGTGTEIGKTHVGVALLGAMKNAGLEVAGLKPVESGVGTDVTDADRLAGAGSFHVKRVPPYRLTAPLSPHLAAPRDGVTIELGPIVEWVDSVTASWTLVETAGGLLSPLSSTATNLDLAVALKPDALVLVAPDRLGVLHDVTAALLALRVLARHLPEPVVVLSTPLQTDGSTGTNAGELQALRIASRVVAFPRSEAGERDTLEAAEELLRVLARAN